MATRFSVIENRAWKRPFFTIWILQAFSLFGSQLVMFAIIWHLTSKTGSATVLATATMAGILPGVFLSPFIGTLVDRWDRRKIMIVSDSLVAGLTAILAVLFLFEIVETWHIYTILFLRAICGNFHHPAMIASTSLMVPKEHLTRIQGLNQIVGGSLNIIAAPLGALLLSLISTQAILAIDFVTAAAAVFPLLFIMIPRPDQTEEKTDEKPSILADMKSGLLYIFNWKGLFIIALINSLLKFLSAPPSSFMPLLIKDHFKGGAVQLGYMSSALGIGLLVGGLILSTWGGFKRRIITNILGLAGIGICMILLGIFSSNMFYPALFANFTMGIMFAVNGGAMGAIIQSVVDPGIQGRVLTLFGSISGAMMPISLMIAGPLVDIIGLQTMFVIAGVACAVMVLVQLTTPSVLKIEEGVS